MHVRNPWHLCDPEEAMVAWFPPFDLSPRSPRGAQRSQRFVSIGLWCCSLLHCQVGHTCRNLQHHHRCLRPGGRRSAFCTVPGLGLSKTRLNLFWTYSALNFRPARHQPLLLQFFLIPCKKIIRVAIVFYTYLGFDRFLWLGRTCLWLCRVQCRNVGLPIAVAKNVVLQTRGYKIGHLADLDI